MLVVEGEDQLVVHQHVLTPRLVLKVLDLAAQALVVREEWQARVELAFDQRLANEDLARLGGVHRAIVDAPPLVHHQPVQRTALEGHDLPGLLFPVRITPAAAQQVAANLLQPFRLDARQGATEQTTGFHEFRRHGPASHLAGDGRARPQMEFDAPRPDVFAAGRILALATDIAEQAGQ